MTGQERIARCESILRRQKSGKISGERASFELDEMMMAESSDGRLIYYSDSTGFTADWDPDVMLFPKIGFFAPIDPCGPRMPSNTGIYALGPKRGWLITRPSEAEPDCMPEVLEHFKKGSKGWDK